MSLTTAARGTGTRTRWLTELCGVILSPARTFEGTAPDSKGVVLLLMTTALVSLPLPVLYSTDFGKAQLRVQVERTLSTLPENLPETIRDQVHQRAYGRLQGFNYKAFLLGAPLILIVTLLITVGVYVALLVIYGEIVTFSQLLIVFALANVVIVLQRMFRVSMVVATGDLRTYLDSTSVAVFLPERIGKFVIALDFFELWWAVVVGIGIARLVHRRPVRVTTVVTATYCTIVMAWRYISDLTH